MAANHGIMAANFIEMTANQVLSPAPEVSFLRSREIFHQKKNCFTLGAGSLSVCSRGHETIGIAVRKWLPAKKFQADIMVL